MTTMTAFHYRRNPPRRPPSCSGPDPDRLRRPRRRHPCTTNRHDAARFGRTAGGSIRRDRNTVCVRAPSPSALVGAVHSHSGEKLHRAAPARHPMACGLFVSVVGLASGMDAANDFSDDGARAHPIFHHHARRPYGGGGVIDGFESCWHWHYTPPSDDILVLRA